MLVSETSVAEEGPASRLEISGYLRLPIRILREACREAGKDDDGRRCPTCNVRDLCEHQAERVEA